MTTPVPRKSLSFLLAVCLAALALLSTLTSLLILEKSATATLRDQIGQNLAELAYQTTDKLDHGLFERYREVELLSRERFLGDAGWSVGEAEKRLNDIQQTYPAYSWIGIADLTGKVVASTHGMIRGADVSKRPWWNNAQHDVHLGDLHDAKLLSYKLPKLDGEPVRFIDVAFPYKDGAGVMRGVVGVHMSWQWAQEIERSVIEPAQQRAKVDALIVSTDGTVLLGPNAYRNKKIAVPSLAAARGGANRFTIEKWDDGNEYLVGFSVSKPYKSSPGLAWTVLVRQSTQEAFAPVRKLQAQVLYGGLAVSLFFTIFAWCAAHRIAQPMRILAQDAKEIQRGQRASLSQPATAYREVAELGHAFTDLIDDLNRHEALLRETNSKLEQRVTERTAEAVKNATHLRLIADNLPVMVAYVDRGERYTFGNRAYLEHYGIARENMVGTTVAKLHGPQMYGIVRPYIARVLKGERVVFVNPRIKDSGTTYLQMSFIPDVQADGTVAGFYSMTQDITDSTNQKLRLQHEALHDSLTGLPNRAACMEQIKGAIARAHRSKKALAVMFMDIDKFKTINDTHGHAAGDQVLIAFAARLTRCMRETDYVSRLAGDEFVVVAEGLSGKEEDAILVVDKILAELGAPLASPSMPDGISSSVGVALHVAGDTTAALLLKQADAAMYQAKRAGGGRVACFGQDLIGA